MARQSDRLTPIQFNTLEFIVQGGGKTGLLPVHWRSQHYQALIRRGFLRLRADPFKTKAIMLYGRVTARGRKAVLSTRPLVKMAGKAIADRDYEKYMREREAGYHE